MTKKRFYVRTYLPKEIIDRLLEASDSKGRTLSSVSGELLRAWLEAHDAKKAGGE